MHTPNTHARHSRAPLLAPAPHLPSCSPLPLTCPLARPCPSPAPCSPLPLPLPLTCQSVDGSGIPSRMAIRVSERVLEYFKSVEGKWMDEVRASGGGGRGGGSVSVGWGGEIFAAGTQMCGCVHYTVE